MTFGEALRQTTGRLKAAGVGDPGRDARLLVAHAADVPPDRVRLLERDSFPATETLEPLVQLREARKPIAMILGAREFWGRRFKVSEDTLVPRPDTEILIEEALSGPVTRVLDLGTGTGAIIVTLLAERPEATGVATDISTAALEVAGENAQAFGVFQRLDLVQSDWWENVDGQFDLIVSNPPYISDAEMAELDRDVKDWDPRIALTPGGDGLDAYRAISGKAKEHLSVGGRLILEIGATQRQAVSEILARDGFHIDRCRTDLDGRDRVVSAGVSC